MEIEHAGLAIFRANGLEAALEEAVGKKPEISASARGPVSAESAKRRNWYFHEAAIRKWIEGEARLFGNSVEIVMDRKCARTELVSGFVQGIEGPEIEAEKVQRSERV